MQTQTTSSTTPRRRSTGGKSPAEPPKPGAVRHRRASSSVWFGPTVGHKDERELMAFLGAHNGVAVLQWPRDAQRAHVLAEAGLPRLLLVHPSPEPPPACDRLQMALPQDADVDEIRRCLESLRTSAAMLRLSAVTPRLDDNGTLQAGGGRVELLDRQRRLARALLDHFGEPVGDDELLSCGAQLASRNCLDGLLDRLCEAVNPLGLQVAELPGDAHVMRWCPI